MLSNRNTRPTQISLNDAYSFFIAYIKEYLDYRHGFWNTYVQTVVRFFSSTSEDRIKACKRVLSEIIATKPDQPQELFRIIQELGRLGKSAQEEKPQEGLTKSLTSVLRDEYSAFSQMCHALRTYMVYQIKNSELKRAYETEIQQLHAAYQTISDDITKKRAARRLIREAEAERDKIVWKLLFLQDAKMLGVARENKWLGAMTDTEVEQLPLSNELKETLYKEYPLTFQDNFYGLYNYMYLDGQANIKNAARENNYSHQLVNARKILIGSLPTSTNKGENQFLERKFAESDIKKTDLLPPPSTPAPMPPSEQEIFERELRAQCGAGETLIPTPQPDTAPFDMKIQENYGTSISPQPSRTISPLQAHSLYRTPELTSSQETNPDSPEIEPPVLKT